MGRITDYLTGRDLVPNDFESRTIIRGTTAEELAPIARTALPAVTESTALRCNDIFACVRVLANAVASLPTKVYRRLPDGSRLPAGNDQRLAQLLRRPEPGSTSADLFSTAMVHLLVHGDAFLAKFRSEGSISQLGLLDPQAIVVERQGARLTYKLSRPEGFSEHGPEDVLHVKAMSSDGLRGLSTVRAAGRVLGLNQGLIDYACAFLGNASRPGGILAVTGDLPLQRDQAEGLKEEWQDLFRAQGTSAGAGKIAVLSGDSMSFERVEPPMKDSEFLAQRGGCLPQADQAPRVPPHRREHRDRRRHQQPEGDHGVHGPLDHHRNLRPLRAPDAREPG